ncbi:MAG: VanW family protein [Bacillota bacterium]
MNSKWGLKLFVVLFLSTAFLISFSHIGANAYEKFFNKGTFELGTQIGSVNVEKMTKKQAITELERKLITWFEEEHLLLSINEQNMVIGQEFFFFEFPKTVDYARNGESNRIVVEIDQAVYEAELKAELNDFYNIIDHEQLQSVLINAVNSLSPDQQMYSIQEYVKNDLDTVVAEKAIVTTFDQAHVQKVIDIVGTIEVPPGSQVSFAELLKDATKFSQEGLNVVSATLYKTLLQTNFEIVERHTSLELPANIELGYEAKVIPGKSDLKWFNSNETNYTISFQLTNSVLYVTVNGAPFLNSYQVKLSEQTSYPPKSIIRYTSLLNEGHEKVVEEGKEGLFVKVSRDIFDVGGALLETEDISKDFYPPTHRIIETGLLNSLKNGESEEILTPEEPTENNVSEDDNKTSESTRDEEAEPNSNSGSESNKENEEKVPNEQDDVIWETPSLNEIEK